MAATIVMGAASEELLSVTRTDGTCVPWYACATGTTQRDVPPHNKATNRSFFIRVSTLLEKSQRFPRATASAPSVAKGSYSTHKEHSVDLVAAKAWWKYQRSCPQHIVFADKSQSHPFCSCRLPSMQILSSASSLRIAQGQIGVGAIPIHCIRPSYILSIKASH